MATSILGNKERTRRITFYNRFLEPVRSGRKTTTIRKARLMRNLEAGHTLVMAFGSYSHPTIVQATCTAKTSIDPAALSRDDRATMAAADGISIDELDAALDTPEELVLVRFELS